MSLQEYLRELKKIKLLEPQQEAELWRSYKCDNDNEARRVLIESYQPLVFKAAGGFRGADNMMDILQEGTVGLIEAVENYDFTRGVAFSLYALHRIRGRMLDFVRREGKGNLAYIDSPVYNDAAEDGNGMELVDMAPPVAVQAEESYLIDELKRAMKRLPDKEQLVLDGVYLKQQEPKDVAKQLEVTPSHIYRLQKQGIRRVRGMLSKLMQHW